MPAWMTCYRCDFRYTSPLGGTERGSGPGWMSTVCYGCGDVCQWATRWCGGPEDGEIVRRMRPGEAPWAPWKVDKPPRPRGPGRSAAKHKAPEDPGIWAKAEYEKWAAAMAEVRDDDVLACYRHTVIPGGLVNDFRFESQDELACQVCAKKGLLRLWMSAKDPCPRCHQQSLISTNTMHP